MSRKTRNLIWSAPLVAAIAVIGALALFVVLAPNDASAQADAAPGRPGTLTAVAFADGTPETEILLMWSAPTTGGSPTHYRIDQSTNGGNTWTALRSNVNDTRFLHTGLNAGETYHYQVFAVSGNLVSPKSNSSTATTAPVVKPESPDNLVVTIQTVIPDDEVADSEGELTIELEWTAPPDPKGAPVLDYVVQYALIETPGSWTELKESDPDFEFTDVTTAEHSDLDAGRTYRYQVAAYNKNRKVDDETVYDPNFLGPWASPDAATTLDGAPPGVITPISVRIGVSPAVPKIFLYWPPPGDTLGDPVNAYKVEGRPTTKPDGSPLNYNNSEADTIADDTACGPANAQGDPPTGGCPFVAIKDNIGRPNGEFIHSFEVTVSDVNRNTRYDKYFTTMANWEYRIRAKNRSTPDGTETADQVAVGRSTIDGSVLTEFLKLPASLRVDPSEDTAHHEGRTGLALTWNKSQTNAPVATRADASHYRIEYSNTGPRDPGGYDWRRLGPVSLVAPTDSAAAKQTGSDNATVEHQLATDPDQVAKDEHLAAGQTRYYRVFALAGQTDQIMSWPSDQRSGTTANAEKPDPPTDLTATAASHTSIELRWVAPDGNGTVHPLDDMEGSEEGPSVIVGYYIQYLEDGASWKWAHIQKDGSNLITNAKGEPDIKYTHKGLAPGSSREYRMAAVNKISSSEQRSDWTELVKGSTVQIPLPNAVAGLVVEATGQNTIDMTWLAQAEQPEDAEVTEYIIEQSPDGKEGTFTMLTSVTMMTEDDVHTIHVDTGLSPNTERHYRVYAKNARGRSDQVSNVASVTTSERMNTAPTAGAAIADQTVMVDATVMVQSTIIRCRHGRHADLVGDVRHAYVRHRHGGQHGHGNHHGRSGRHGHHHGDRHRYRRCAMATQEIIVTVTVEAAEPEEVGPATGVTTGPFNEGGVIQVNWDPAPNATGYIIYAVNVDELNNPDGQIVVAPVNDAAKETYNLGGLKSGDTYDIYVVATAKEMVAWPADADVDQVEAE